MHGRGEHSGWRRIPFCGGLTMTLGFRVAPVG